MEMLEAIEVPLDSPDHYRCPFCLERVETPPEPAQSYIGKDNDSTALADALAAAGKPREEVDFFHEVYGPYSAEAHHLVCGKEALRGHPIEHWLSAAVSGSEVNADSGFDINAAANGIWLPSITDMHRILHRKRIVDENGKVTYVRSESEADKTLWGALSEEEKDEIAFFIMEKHQLQFHKGNHRNKGATPDQCYIAEVRRILDDITAYVRKSKDSKLCKTKPDADGKMPPPLGINDFIYFYASGYMRWHVAGPPESWFVALSKLSARFKEHVIQNGALEWATRDKKYLKPL